MKKIHKIYDIEGNELLAGDHVKGTNCGDTKNLSHRPVDGIILAEEQVIPSITVKQKDGSRMFICAVYDYEKNKFIAGGRASDVSWGVKKIVEVEKKFLWKDKTGRGITNTFSLPELLELDANKDKEDWELEDEEDNLSYWAETAEEGDEFETQTEKYICIKS